MDLHEISKLCAQLNLDEKDGSLVRVRSRVYEAGESEDGLESHSECIGE